MELFVGRSRDCIICHFQIALTLEDWKRLAKSGAYLYCTHCGQRQKVVAKKKIIITGVEK